MSKCYLFVRHKVADFDVWYAGYKSPAIANLHRQFQRVSGEVFQSVDDPNDVTVREEFPSFDLAKSFRESLLKAAMLKLGVQYSPPPTIWFARKSDCTRE
jgi:hypothetical protein